MDNRGRSPSPLSGARDGSRPASASAGDNNDSNGGGGGIQSASLDEVAAGGAGTGPGTGPGPGSATASPPNLSTPLADDVDSGTEYFPPLDPTPSAALRSQTSRTQTTRPQPPRSRVRTGSIVSSNSSNNGGAAANFFPGESIRQPTIRIRRRGSSSLAPKTATGAASSDNLTTAGASSPSGLGADPVVGRGRSLSQPERTRTASQDAPKSRQTPRRAPPTAMPRLTEEGNRPTAEELGMPRWGGAQPQQGQPSAPPAIRLSGDGQTDDEDAAEGGPGGRLQNMRTWSRLFRPRALSTSAQGQVQDPDRSSRERWSGEPVRPFTGPGDDTYDERLVDYLDTVDPEVQTLSTLTNLQNSLFVPDLGKWINRRPTYTLSEHSFAQMQKVQQQQQQQQQQEPQHRQQQQQQQQQTPPPPSRAASIVEPLPELTEEGDGEAADTCGGDATQTELRPRLYRSSTITSHLTDSHYAALPHGVTLDGWTAEEKSELDDHVRHMMHSRRAKFKRTMKGFGQYVRRPLGFFVTLYATLITLFGLAWVLFLIGWIYVGDKQVYTIHIIDSVLVALFAIMGDGLAPFRAVDTYHMIFIVRYARLVKKGAQREPSRLRKRSVADDLEQQEGQEQQQQQQQEDRGNASSGSGSGTEILPAANTLQGRSDPPRPDQQRRDASPSNSSADSIPAHNSHMMHDNVVDANDTKCGLEAYENTSLTYAQQKKLYHHQKKLAKSHSFYKPHETETHYAFPIKYLVAIVLLLDCHSCLQIALGACTWGIDYHTRPMAVTTVILCLSITCNITAGVVISLGDKRTRKKDVWMLMDRQELTSDAIKEMENKRTGGDGGGSQTNSTKVDKTGESFIENEKKGGRLHKLFKKE